VTDERVVVMEITTLEAAHLADLVRQFQDLLSSSDVPDDPAVARLTPDPYPDDADAGREFARLTSDELLRRRADDAGTLLRTLFPDGAAPQAAEVGEDEAFTPLPVVLDLDEGAAWLRTLSALRLVLASRLGITAEEDRDDADPRFGVYEWLAMRLDGLVEAMDRAAGGG
jgi:hypothetical protein